MSRREFVGGDFRAPPPPSFIPDPHSLVESRPTIMQPMRFHPLVKRALWGGRRLHTLLGKPIGSENDYAESWEIADLPGNVSRVLGGEHEGRTLHDLVREFPTELMGRHASLERFPLLVKFLDAQIPLSIQVHPNHGDGPDSLHDIQGKAELWVIIEALPESQIAVGLTPGVGRNELREALADGEPLSCLNLISVSAGDAVFLPPGTVHFMGAGIVAAEVQQPCDITYRLDDWGRLDRQGHPRDLHFEEALAAIDESLGPIPLIAPQPLNLPGRPELIADNLYFQVRRFFGEDTFSFPIDDTAHVLSVLGGAVQVQSEESCHSLVMGDSILLPAGRPPIQIELGPEAILIDAVAG
ncbi:MAG: class I mannose-6-phosphate isomerase [Planctomycetaceae bacterium]|nr:class I mannose-6-phosphate isomerase [Planctomycetaceae bacterium]